MSARRTRALRWLLLMVAVVVGGWVAYALGGVLVGLAVGGSAGLLRLLVAAYLSLASGFLIAGVLTRLAPSRRYVVAVALVFVMVCVAGALMIHHADESGPVPVVLLGTSLVVGAFGYALRVRGFSEAVSGRES